MSSGLLDYTNKDYASIRAALLQIAAQRFPAWTDTSPNDLGTMLLELVAYLGDSLFYSQDRIAGESFLETAMEPRSVVQLLRLIGYELTPPMAASAELTLLFDPTGTGPLSSVPAYAAFKATVPGSPPLTFQYIDTPNALALPNCDSLPNGYLDANGHLSLDTNGSPVPPPSPLPKGCTAFRVYQALPVVQVDSNVTDEIVASSTGTAGQRYSLDSSPVVEGTLVVNVTEGGVTTLWTQVATLLNSLGTDTSYQLRYDDAGRAWIEFGDGTYGKVPGQGLNNITASYCVGGGSKGNVPAYAILTPITSISPLLKSVVNVQPATGGAERESTGDASLRGPQVFRSGGRAVTAGDYEALALSFGAAKALAQPAGWNTVQLVVAPPGGDRPTDTFIQDLQAFLEPKRILTSIVEIVGPTYVKIFLSATVYVLPQYSLTSVRQQVSDAVGSYLSFDAYTFNQILYISKVYQLIQDVPGVEGADITLFARDLNPASPIPPSGQLEFGTDGPTQDAKELPVWTDFDGVNSTLTVTRSPT